MNQGKICVVVIVLTVITTLMNNVAVAAEKRERLAVLDLEAKYGVESGFAEAMSVTIRDEIHLLGRYSVMSQEDIRAVVSREQLLQAMGCDDGSNCLVDFGRTLGTRFMVAGSIYKIGSTYTVSLRMLDTAGKNAGLVNRVSESCKCTEDALIEIVKKAAAKLVDDGIQTAQDTVHPQIAEDKSEAAEKKATFVAVEVKKKYTAEKVKQEGEKTRPDEKKSTIATAQREQKPIPKDKDNVRKAVFTVQLTSSQNPEKAYNVARLLQKAGYPAFTSSMVLEKHGVWHRIYVGSYTTREEGMTVKAALEEDDIANGIIRTMPYAIQVGEVGSTASLSDNIEKLRNMNILPYVSSAQNEKKSQPAGMRLLVGAYKIKEEAAYTVSMLRSQGFDVQVVNR